MKKSLYILLFVLSGSLFIPISGQTPIPIPYFCGFEDPAENANWQLNYGPLGDQADDQWHIGSGARSEGRNSLYISVDGGISAEYGYENPNVVVAYREFEVPVSIRYDISFDWLNNGYTGKSDLYALLIRPSMGANHQPPVSVPSSAVTPAIVNLYNASALNRRSQWQNHSIQQNLIAGEKYILLFIWVNGNTDDKLTYPIGACIDNIQITSTKCAKPYDLKIDASSCDTVRLSWRGSSASHEVQYKSSEQSQWRSLGVIDQPQTSTFLTNIKEGQFDFRIRGICDNDTSAYLTSNSVIVFCEDNHCINYIDLEGPHVTAFYGDYTNPKKNVGLRDLGSSNKFSRHTVNGTPNEFDPYTGNQLSTIPEREIASVRLGNWNNNAEAECLVYQFPVTEDYPLLIMKYAIVFERPNHSREPRFTLRILDENGLPIDPTCGEADFSAVEGLNQLKPGWQIYSGDYYWKDWTTLGLNLEDYIGQTISIELTTYDCADKGHFGYAYFTLSCASAEIQTNTCGDAVNMEIAAPDGFDYKWINPNRPGWSWDKRDFEVPAGDTTTYYCEVCFKEENSCCFTLSTAAFPRYPVSSFNYNIITKNCQNIVQFNNLSHIFTIVDDKEVHTQLPCDDYKWEFISSKNSYNDSPRENPELRVSNDGDTIDVKLTAYLADFACQHDTVVRIIVPPIGQTTDTIYRDICYGEPYIFGNTSHWLSGTFSDTVPSVNTGCDSITVLELTVHPQYDMPIAYDTICFGEQYLFGDIYFSPLQTDTVIEVWKQTTFGCDSVLNLKLHVRDEITFDAISTDVLQGPFSGRIDIVNCSLNNYSYSLNGVMNAPLTGLQGGEYYLTVYNEFGCESKTRHLTITQDCLEIDIKNVTQICADEPFFEIPYSIGKGWPTTYDIIFSEEAKHAGFIDISKLPADESPIKIYLPDNIRVNDYNVNILFEDLLCENITTPVSFTINYTSKIISQKWNDVLAVFNTNYNGGYEFSDYQWYRNGEPIDGETSSYLYLNNEELDFNSEYTLLLTRVDDGKSFFTCSFTPERRDEINLYPTILYNGNSARINLPKPAVISIYNSIGFKQSEVKVVAGNGQDLYISDKSGYYFINIQMENGEQYHFKVIVAN